MEARGALFREIHKNTWLKRLTIDNKKITVGSKKSDRSWVVFCVHDDCEAILEGYVEPRQAASHIPEWTVPLQTTLHISHALVPFEQEYEFVITLASDVIRFNASSWEIMQEWVETLRQKLREMKILSPKENLYSKLPEIRAPLLPTRDPTSPLPAPPPVPAAIVPGIERITASTSHTTNTQTSVTNVRPVVPQQTIQPDINDPVLNSTTITTNPVLTPTSSIPITAMSNTLTQNLINMLSNPVSAYSSQLTNINDGSDSSNTSSIEDNFFFDDEPMPSGSGASQTLSTSLELSNTNDTSKIKKEFTKMDNLSSLAKTFSNNVLADPNTCPSTSGLSSHNSLALRDKSTNKLSFEHDAETSSTESTPSTMFQAEPLIIPRPHTTRSSAREKRANTQIPSVIPTTIAATTEESGSTNITIIQVSSPLTTAKSSTKDIFNFPTNNNAVVEMADDNYKSNVQIIPSNFSPSATSNSTQFPQMKTSTNIVNDHKITTVQVSGATALGTGYGKIIKQSSLTRSESPALLLNNTPSIPSESSNSVRNFGSVTNIPIGNETPSIQLHYEQVFVTPSSTPIPSTSESHENRSVASSKISLLTKQQKSTSHAELHINRINLQNNRNKENNAPDSTVIPSTSTATQSVLLRTVNNSNKKQVISGSTRENLVSPLPAIRQFLTRGLTEAAISRPSRKDANAASRGRSKITNTSNPEIQPENLQDSREHRRRSSSTSDAQGARLRTAANNNSDARRMQPAPQPFRPENTPHSSGRLTLREQQVIHLRREMMHPGGVRIQLRRKDCTGSIALVDAFGAVWISGWKQKDHPMLYNALHIGDQLVSVAGVTVSSAADSNRIIRNSPGLYIELIIRRIPFGRVYAIRRELDGQCLGLIRDGNTATIVDVVPNSLSARHGLPPKAQSCDGLSLTFWVLTEINGRPLNLFFKDNEVRDRLNAVGRDISILVQPSDLVAKLKKQLKSLRSYKDYIVQ